VLRCLLLATMENPEPRYTLEFFPVLIVAAAAALVPAKDRQSNGLARPNPDHAHHAPGVAL